MKKGLLSFGIVWILLIAGLLGVITFWPENVSAQTTIYVWEGNTGFEDGSLANPYNTISEGVTAASDGDTVFVFNGTYDEQVIITKSINLTGEHRTNTTIINSSVGQDVVRIAANWVNVTGFTITNGNVGIRVMPPSTNVTIWDNIITLNNMGTDREGIRIGPSRTNITIFGNEISENENYGIYIDQWADNNTIDGNVITSSMGQGIYVYSSYNTIIGNIVITQGIGIYVNAPDNDIIGNDAQSVVSRGIYITGNNNDIIGNNVDGIYLEGTFYNDVIGNTVANGEGIALFGSFLNPSSDNNIIGNSISNVVLGIDLTESNNNIIENNNVSSNDYGIMMVSSSNNDFTNNNVSAANYDAIHLESSNNNNLTANDILSYNWYGISFNLSHGNRIKNHVISYNGGVGIWLNLSTGNSLINNLVSNNDYGIYFRISDGNNITENTLSLNTLYGLYLQESSNNSIYHNNILDNADQAFDDGNNMWNNTLPFGGNFWSDWYYPDMDCDTFVDDPYVINGGSNSDFLPHTWMDAWLNDWVNKSAYPNYAPSGMPDFDQREKAQRTAQNYWMAIHAGPDGLLQSVQAGDDVLIDPNPGSNNISIAPGSNHMIDSTLGGDDTLEYAYCGPAAAANCLWWLDSKFADHTGTPGDGTDNHFLVMDMSVGDDHQEDNVPLLAENLAERFFTNDTGDTNVSRMVDGINQLLADQALQNHYNVHNESWPIFEYVAQESEACNDVILFLGFYDDEGNRHGGHIVTVSGVSAGTFHIGISDPIKNIANMIADYTAYNDAINVSHDVYMAMPGPPPATNPPPLAMLWLNGYTFGYSYPIPPLYWAIVEHALVISPNSVPDAPTNLNSFAGVGYINITWDPPVDDGGAPITNYLIYRGSTSGGEVFYQMIGNVTYFNDTGLPGGITYYYRVSAQNAIGEGPLSNEAYNTTLLGPLTVDFILLTYSPNGTEIPDISLDLGVPLLIYASGYNNSGPTYVDLVEVDWTSIGPIGFFDNATGNSSTFTGTLQSSGTIKGENGTLGVNDTFQLTILGPSTIDYVNITDAPNGTPLASIDLPIGGQIIAYASGYNDTTGYVDLIEVNWTQSPLGFGSLTNLTETSTQFTAGFSAGTVVLNGTNASDPSLADEFIINILPPEIDFVYLTDAPNGTPYNLATQILDIGSSMAIYASGYNNTGPTFVDIVLVNWTETGGLGSFLPTQGNQTLFTAGVTTGLTTIQGENTTLTVFDSFQLDIIEPTNIDYILITNTPNGTELAIVNLNVGENITIYASAYNATGPTYLGLVEVNWTQSTLLGLFNTTTGNSTTFTAGNSGGSTIIEGSNTTFAVSDNFTLNVNPPKVDYIVILTTLNVEILDQLVPTNFEIEGKAGAFNNTVGPIGDIWVNWSVVNASGASAYTSPESGTHSNFSAGQTTGSATWTADDGKGHTDTVVFTIEPPTIDYIDITDVPGGMVVTGGEVSLGFIEWGNCSMYNNTLGYFGIVAANWTVVGGNASLQYTTPATRNGIDVGTIPGVVWFNASYFNGTYWFNDSIIYYPTPKVDRIEITDTPDGEPLTGGIVPVDFTVWGNCSMYNNTIGYLGTVIANWSALGGNSSLLDVTPSISNGIYVGMLAATIWFNASFGGLTDSVVYLLDQPSLPQNIQIISGNSWINISWNAPASEGSSPIENYTIYKGNVSGGTVLFKVLGNVTYFNDTDVTNGEIYYYRISANNSLGEGPISDEMSIMAGSVPSPPRDLTATVGVTYIHLTWSAPEREGGLPVTNYIIYKNNSAMGGIFLVQLGNVFSYTDYTVTNGTTYYYWVTAVNAKGEGDLPNPVSGTPLGPPTAPISLTATSGDSHVNLTWDIPFSDGGSSITGFNIYRNDTQGVYANVPLNQLWYNDTGVQNNNTYIYNITAVNIIGEGPPSNNVTATPAPYIPPPNQIPTVTLDEPSPGAIVSGIIWINGTASDPDGTIEKVEIKIGDADWVVADGNTSWSYRLDTTTLSNGIYKIIARSYDGKNYSQNASINIEVENKVSGPEKSIFEEPWFWFFIVLLIIFLLLIFFLFTKMKRRPREEEEEEEEFEEEEIEEEEEPEEEEEFEEEEEEEEPEEEFEEEIEEEEPEEEEPEEEGEPEEEEELKEEEEPEEVTEEKEEPEEVIEEEEEPEKEAKEAESEEKVEEAKEEPEVKEEPMVVGMVKEEAVAEEEKPEEKEEPKKEEEAELEEEVEVVEVFECPKCGATISSSDTKCPSCGVEFAE